MGNQLTIPVNNSRIITQAVYDEDGKGLVLIGANKVIFTVRLLEDSAAFLIQLPGVVEYVGGGDTDPGIVASELMPDDIVATPGIYWFDTTITFLGYWFDQGVHIALDFYFLYGKTAEPRAGKNPLWHEVAAGFVALANNAVNFVEVTTTGTLSANIVGFTVDRIPLYQVTTSAGVIVTVSTVDRRTVWTRGDRVFTSVKDRFEVIYAITKTAEITLLGG